MNKVELIMIIVASVLAVGFIVVRVALARKDNTWGVMAMFAKTVASLAFIAIGVAGLYCGVKNVQAALFILCGLIMGMVGDIVLDLKVVYRGKSEEGVYLTGGMAAFAIGHVFFLTALILFLGKGVITGGVVGICLAVTAVFDAVVMLASKYIMKFTFGNFFIHSVIYGFCLIFMTALAIALCIVTKSTVMIQFAVGMGLFLISDVFLSQMYFGGRPTDSALCILNHATYYAAQICIAAFIFVM